MKEPLEAAVTEGGAIVLRTGKVEAAEIGDKGFQRWHLLPKVLGGCCMFIVNILLR